MGADGLFRPKPGPDGRRKLNLGCGYDYRSGWVNLDIKYRADVHQDILRFPWPFPEASFEHILASHVFEHIPPTLPGTAADALTAVVQECYRILAVGGTLEILVPHGDLSAAEWQRSHTHYRILTPESFLPFTTAVQYAHHIRDEARVLFDVVDVTTTKKVPPGWERWTREGDRMVWRAFRFPRLSFLSRRGYEQRIVLRKVAVG
jgi:predicted SAM-dependent methyltransferase